MGVTTAPSAPLRTVPEESSAAQKRMFWSVGVGHFAVDLMNATGSVLMAFIASHLIPMSNTQIGVAISAYQLAGSLSQPLFGYLGDKTGGRLLGAGGVAWTIIFYMLSMVGASMGSYILMVVPFVIAALGSGAFHPIGAMYAAESDKAHAGRNTSIFFLAGQVGAGIGPVLIGFLLDRTAMANSAFTAFSPALMGRLTDGGSVAPLWVLGLMLLPTVLFMVFALPSREAYRATHPPRAKGVGGAGQALQTGALVTLAILITMRSFANPGSIAFVARLFALKGWTSSEYGLIVSLLWLSGGIAGVFFARWAERWNSRAVINLTLMLGAPCMLLLPEAQGLFAIILALLIGALTGGSHSLIVVMSQRLMPTAKGFASGLTLGFIFAMGAVGTLIIGAAADRVGVDTAYRGVAVLTFFTGLVALRLPAQAMADRAAETMDEQEAEALEAADPFDVPGTTPENRIKGTAGD